MVDSRVRVRAIFAAVVLLFVAQTWFTSVFDEPWPALAMPPFPITRGLARAALYGDSHALVFGFADAEEREVTWERLWPPALKLGDGLAILCGSEARQPPSGAPYRWFPSYHVGLFQRAEPGSRAAVSDWLRGRARVLLPGREPSWFECRTFLARVRVRDGSIQRERWPRSTRRLELAP